MILPDKKVIFIHLPKCGGSSIEVSLARHADEIVQKENEHSITLRYGAIQREIEKYFKITFENYKHLTARQYKEFLGKEYDDYFVFSVMREPLDRIQSLAGWSHTTLPADKLSAWKIVEDNQRFHPSWLPGDRFLLDRDDKLIVDKVLNFNNLTNEFNDLISSLNFKNIILPHLNKSKASANRSISLIDVNIDNVLKSIIEKYYASEVELYNSILNS